MVQTNGVKEIWVGRQRLTTRKKETRAFYLYVRDRLSAAELEDKFPSCFHNNKGELSTMSFREIFWDNSDRSIIDCYYDDFIAIMNLTRIPGSILHFEFGLAQRNITTAQINKLMQKEGYVSGAVCHQA